MAELTALKRHYSSLLDDELRGIATTTELEPEARVALQQELQRRGIRDLDEYKQQMDADAVARVEQERARLGAREKRLRLYGRAGYALCGLVGIIGAAQYLVGGDARSGLGTMAIAAICVPVVWLNVWIRLVFIRSQRWAWQRSHAHSRPTVRSSGRSPANAGSRH